MEWPEPRDRMAFRSHVRAQLRNRGLLEFVDDDIDVVRRAELVYMNVADVWREEASQLTKLKLQGVKATSTDDPLQSINNTVAENDEFWSSTGAGTRTAGEALLYRVAWPGEAAQLAYVGLAVYRAHYQHGDPMYPPTKVSFLTGPTPNQLYPASPLYPVRLTDAMQVFALSPAAPLCRYLMVRLHGRGQRQWGDLQYYIAIRHVHAYGRHLPYATAAAVPHAVHASLSLAWPASRGADRCAAEAEAAARARLAAMRAEAAAGDRARSDGRAPSPLALALAEEEAEWGPAPDPDPARRFLIDHIAALAAARGFVGGARAAPGRGGLGEPDVYDVAPDFAPADAERAAQGGVSWARRAAPWAAEGVINGPAPRSAAAPGPVCAHSGPAPPPPAAPPPPHARARGPRPTGPSASELQVVLEQEQLSRAVRHLAHLPWPSVVAAGPVTALVMALQAAPAAATAAVTDDALAKAMASPVELPQRPDGGRSGGGEASGAGGSTAAAAAAAALTPSHAGTGVAGAGAAAGAVPVRVRARVQELLLRADMAARLVAADRTAGPRVAASGGSGPGGGAAGRVLRQLLGVLMPARSREPAAGQQQQPALRPQQGPAAAQRPYSQPYRGGGAASSACSSKRPLTPSSDPLARWLEPQDESCRTTCGDEAAALAGGGGHAPYSGGAGGTEARAVLAELSYLLSRHPSLAADGRVAGAVARLRIALQPAPGLAHGTAAQGAVTAGTGAGAEAAPTYRSLEKRQRVAHGAAEPDPRDGEERRQGDGRGAAAAGAGSGGEGAAAAVLEAERRRSQRRHRRAAQRTLQPAAYTPGGPLFVLLGGRARGGAAAAGPGAWHVSHYDNEHLV